MLHVPLYLPFYSLIPCIPLHSHKLEYKKKYGDGVSLTKSRYKRKSNDNNTNNVVPSIVPGDMPTHKKPVIKKKLLVNAATPVKKKDTSLGISVPIVGPVLDAPSQLFSLDISTTESDSAVAGQELLLNLPNTETRLSCNMNERPLSPILGVELKRENSHVGQVVESRSHVMSLSYCESLDPDYHFSFSFLTILSLFHGINIYL